MWSNFLADGSGQAGNSGVTGVRFDENTNTLIFMTDNGEAPVDISSISNKITSFAVDANTNAIVLKTDKGDFSISGDEIKTILGTIATNSGDTIQSVSFDEQTKTLTLATDKGEFSAVINIQTQASGGLSISAVSIDANTNVLTIEEGGNKHTVDLTPIVKNLYSTDGTIDANRKVLLDGKTLTFEGANYPTVKVLSTDTNGGVVSVGDAGGEMQIYSKNGSLFIWSSKLNRDILRYDANVNRWTFFDPIRPKTIIDKAGSTGDADFILTSDGQGGLEWKDDIRAKLIETKHHMELSQRTDGDITYANNLLSITQSIRYTLFAGNVWTVDAITDMNVPDGSVVYFATNEQEMLSGNTKQVPQAQLLVEPLDTWIAAHDKIPVGFSRKGVFYLLNGDSSFKPQAAGSTLYSSDGAINEDRTVTVNANLKFANNQVSFDKLNPSVILDKNASDGSGFNVLKSDDQGGIVWTPLEPISNFETAIKIIDFPTAVPNQYYFKEDTGDVYLGKPDGSFALVDRSRISEGATLKTLNETYVFSAAKGWVIKQASATTTKEIPNPLWEVVHQRVTDSYNGTKQLNYVVVGDSTRSATYSMFENYYSQRLQAIKANYTQGAVSGQSAYIFMNGESQNLTFDRPVYSDVVANIQGDGSDTVIELSMGINDYGTTKSYETTDKLEIKNRIKAIIDKFKADKPNVAFVLVVPVYTSNNSRNVLLQQIYQELSQEYSFPLIDALDIMREVHPLTLNNDDFYRDNTHPNHRGAKRLVNYIFAHVLPSDIRDTVGVPTITRYADTAPLKHIGSGYSTSITVEPGTYSSTGVPTTDATKLRIADTKVLSGMPIAIKGITTSNAVTVIYLDANKNYITRQRAVAKGDTLYAPPVFKAEFIRVILGAASSVTVSQSGAVLDTVYPIKAHDFNFARINRPESEILYVSPTGTSAGDGTKANPLDLTSAISKLDNYTYDANTNTYTKSRNTGKTVIRLLEGTYKISTDPNTLTRFRFVNCSGSATKPNIVEADIGANVVIDGGAYNPNASYDNWFDLNLADTVRTYVDIQSDNLIFRGIEVIGCTNDSSILVGSGKRNVKVEHVFAHHNLGTGVYFFSTESCEIRYSTLCYNTSAQAGITNYPQLMTRFNNGGNTDGLAMGHSNNGRAYKCAFYYNSDDGVDLWGATHITIERCVSFKNGYKDDGVTRAGIGDGEGLKMGGGNVAPNYNVAIGNLSFYNRNTGLKTNVAGNAAQKFRYNTIYGNAAAGIEAAPDTVIENNIAFGNGSDIYAPTTSKTNSWDIAQSVDFISTEMSSPDFLKPTDPTMQQRGYYAYSDTTLQFNASQGGGGAVVTTDENGLFYGYVGTNGGFASYASYISTGVYNINEATEAILVSSGDYKVVAFYDAAYNMIDRVVYHGFGGDATKHIIYVPKGSKYLVAALARSSGESALLANPIALGYNPNGFTQTEINNGVDLAAIKTSKTVTTTSTQQVETLAEFAQDLLLEVENDKAVTTHTLLNGLTWEQAKTQYDTFRFVLKAGNGVYQDSVYSAELDAKDIVNNIRLFHISHDNATMFIRYTIKDTATGEIVNESANTAPHAIRVWGIKKPNGFARVSALRSERITTNITVGVQEMLTPALKDWETIDVTLSQLSGLSANVFVTREEITNSQVRVVPVFDGTNLVAATLQISPNADGTIRIGIYQAPTGTAIKSITLKG